MNCSNSLFDSQPFSFNLFKPSLLASFDFVVCSRLAFMQASEISLQKTMFSSNRPMKLFRIEIIFLDLGWSSWVIFVFPIHFSLVLNPLSLTFDGAKYV